MDAAPVVNPIRVVGRYALYDTIASGGMATVHIGRLNGAVGFVRTVAIKRLLPQYARDPEFVSMFVDEARLAARVRHPNVVQTLDIVAAEHELFLVMEYVPGESVSHLMRLLSRTREHVPPAIVASIVSGALHGLHAAHEARDDRGEILGLVHRDVSPQNVIVGIDGVARVLDFGVARATGRVHTSQVGKMKGKISYMAPEQAQDGVVTRQADVYGAGVIAWEMLTGRRLFAADSAAGALSLVLHAAVRPPSEMVAGLPRAFDQVILRALSRDPAARYGSALEFANALESCAGAESQSGVEEWVGRVASDPLRERASRVARIESSTDVSHVLNLRAMVNDLASGSLLSQAADEPSDPAPPRLAEKAKSDETATAAQIAPEARPLPRWVLTSVGAVIAALILVTAWAFRDSRRAVVHPAPGNDASALTAKAPSPPASASNVQASPAPSFEAPGVPDSKDESAPGGDAHPAPVPVARVQERVREHPARPAKAKRKTTSPFADLGGRQ